MKLVYFNGNTAGAKDVFVVERSLGSKPNCRRFGLKDHLMYSRMQEKSFRADLGLSLIILAT